MSPRSKRSPPKGKRGAPGNHEQVCRPTLGAHHRPIPKSAKVEQVDDANPLSGFGCSFDASGLSTGSTTVRDELGLTVTDFFVYNPSEASQVYNYWWDLEQAFMNSSDSTASTFSGSSLFSRVREVHLWAMPRRAVLQNNVESFYTCNVQAPAVVEAAAGAKASAVQVTNVVPTFTNSWKKVFSLDYKKTFNDTQIRPYVASERMLLFQLLVTNPSTGSVFPVSVPTEGGSEITRGGIQFRVVLKLDQPIAPAQLARKNATLSSTFADPGAPGQITDQYVQVSCDGRLDLMG